MKKDIKWRDETCQSSHFLSSKIIYSIWYDCRFTFFFFITIKYQPEPPTILSINERPKVLPWSSLIWNPIAITIKHCKVKLSPVKVLTMHAAMSLVRKLYGPALRRYTISSSPISYNNKTRHHHFSELVHSMAKPVSIEVWNPSGKYRVVSTKPMPGTRWINLLIQQDCRLEVINYLYLLLSFFFSGWWWREFDFFNFVSFLLCSDMYWEENNTVSWRYHCFDWWKVWWSYRTGNYWWLELHDDEDDYDQLAPTMK